MHSSRYFYRLINLCLQNKHTGKRKLCVAVLPTVDYLLAVMIVYKGALTIYI